MVPERLELKLMREPSLLGLARGWDQNIARFAGIEVSERARNLYFPEEALIKRISSNSGA